METNAQKSKIYNEKKLTPIFETMGKVKVLVLGGGAIGSFICETLVRNGTKHLSIVDKDYYEEDNYAKSSFVIRYPEDINISKAHALANRLSVLAKEGTTIRGFNMDIKKIGPLALSEFDYVVLALDSTAMRIFAQKLVKLCPEQRPILLSCGTTGESSEAMIFTQGACLRCTVPNTLLKAENPETVHSCAAKINYLLPQKTMPIVSTSGIASMKSALDIDDMITSHAHGTKKFPRSEKYIQAPYPDKNGHSTLIAPLVDCPVCSMEPPKDFITLKGSTYHTTLRELLHSVSDYFEEPYKLKVHVLEIPGMPDQIYDQYVIREKCHVCGKEFRLCKHSGDIREIQIVCDECNANSKKTSFYSANENAEETRYFSLEETDDDILDKTLFDLGYPIGCYYEIESSPAPSLAHEVARELTIDTITDNDTVCDSKVFALRDDRFFLTSE